VKRLLPFFSLVLIILAIILPVAWVIKENITLNIIQDNWQFICDYVLHNKALAVLIYCVIYCTVISLSIPVATIMTITGGYLFGQLTATIAATISATAGGSLLFLTTKLLSGNINNKSNNKWVQMVKDGFTRNAFLYIITLRLLPIIPFVMINIATGILQIPFKAFFFGTIIGVIPGTFIYVSLGVAMKEILNYPELGVEILLQPKILLSLTGLACLVFLAILYRKKSIP
jgi:uncharacterized membrane protein YdjX (TVP38/TMEM64 family)